MTDSLHHHLPHLRAFAKQPVVFITVCTFGRQRVLASAAMHVILTETWSKARELHGWAVGRYVIMPDHVHLFARAEIHAATMAVWLKSWKSFTARRAKQDTIVGGPLWQADYFDRYLRSDESYSEKWNYVENNPVRGGLVQQGEQWKYQGEVERLEF